MEIKKSIYNFNFKYFLPKKNQEDIKSYNIRDSHGS